MLNNYDTLYKETTNQILVIDNNGMLVDVESNLFNHAKGEQIVNLHPFFSTFNTLLNNPNENYNFVCINLDVNSISYTIDGVLYTNKANENAVFVFQDLTKQYIRYQKVAQNRNEAEIKSQVLDFNNRLLQEKEKFKDNFIANFSHEIRLPVMTIDGFLALLEESNLEQTQRYHVNVIKNTNGRLKAMINDILDISKIETNHFQAYNIRYNLIEELNIIVDIYKRKCEEKGLQLHFNIDKNCPKYVIADKYRLAQIASNIIGNAIKFTPRGSITLNVDCKSKNKNRAVILFSVNDTGIGIEQKQLNKIYNSFYQISNNIPNVGAGLGLAIVKNLVKALNGEIKIKSKLGEGSTVETLLTFKIDNNQDSEKKDTESYKKASIDSPKILIAEPLKKEKELLIKSLKNKQNYNIDSVETGDQVIEALHKNSYDLVILNLKLPTMDGLDTARFIRYSDFTHLNNIPIIALSEKPSREEEILCKNRKINSYIGKPYDKAELLRKVKYILQKKQVL